MPLSELQQQRLLHWARRFQERLEADERTGEEKEGDARELAAVRKIIAECAPILYPDVAVPSGMRNKRGHVD